MMIGRHATVTGSQNGQLIGISGLVTDETKHTLTINGKRLIKEHITIEGRA